MRHPGTKRHRCKDPLQPLPQPTWLVVRNAHRQPLEWRRIDPDTDLRAILGQERERQIAAGWTCDDIGRVCSFFFCERGGVRLEVGISRYDPDGPGSRGHSDPMP